MNLLSYFSPTLFKAHTQQKSVLCLLIHQLHILVLYVLASSKNILDLNSVLISGQLEQKLYTQTVQVYTRQVSTRQVSTSIAEAFALKSLSGSVLK